MSEQITIKLDLGSGLHTNLQDEMSVSYTDNGHIHIEDNLGEEGLYVDNLNGEDGVGGVSVPDGWTTVDGTGYNISDPSQTTQFIDMNRDVVNLIFTFGLYKATTRNPSNITYGTNVKDVRSICNEIDAPIWFSPSSYTSYKPMEGELIQLVKNPLFRTVPVGNSTVACENGNRLGNDSMETAVMFVITEINYQPGNIYWVTDMTLCCIFSTVPDFVVGQSYTGTQLFDSGHI